MPIPRIFKTYEKTTNAEQVWRFSRPKEGGANGAGEFGGFYTSGSKTCLIKQDTRIALNIAEFLAATIYQDTVPDVSANIQLVRVDEDVTVSPDGRNVYLVSEFINGWDDLYNAIQKFLNRKPGRSKIKIVETSQLVDQLIVRPNELTAFFTAGNASGDYLNFGEIAATSLLINNTDINLGNVGITVTGDGIKKLAVIDYGAAFRDMTAKINPHSFSKYISSHTLNREGWNNFLYYPESIKITSEFVFHLDRVSRFDLAPTLDSAFEKITEFYGIRPIVEFAVRAGFCIKPSEQILRDLENDEGLAGQKIQLIKNAALNALKQRQYDLSRFSAQIKSDMCVQENESSKKHDLDGAFVDTEGHNVTFTDVVFAHVDYFKEIALGIEKFKFRKSTHKRNSQLINEVETRSKYILASFFLVEENKTTLARICNIAINSMEEAINTIQNVRLNKDVWDTILDERHLVHAKQLFSEFEHSKTERMFNNVVGILNKLQLEPAPTPTLLGELKTREKLLKAIIELDQKCDQLKSLYDTKQCSALLTYEKETIQLALEGAASYKQRYKEIEQRAINAIDHSTFNSCVRHIGNIIYLSLMTVTVIGLFAMAYNSKNGQDLLLFSGPKKDIKNLSSEFNKIQDEQILDQGQAQQI
jgi:hypothetical protein